MVKSTIATCSTVGTIRHVTSSTLAKSMNRVSATCSDRCAAISRNVGRVVMRVMKKEMYVYAADSPLYCASSARPSGIVRTCAVVSRNSWYQ